MKSRISRSVLAACVSMGLAAPFAPGTAWAQEPGRASSAEPLTEAKVVERVTVALDRGIKFLADKQQPDGSWDPNQAMNGLTILAFMGRGHVPGRGPYRDKLELGKRYILRNQTDAGMFGGTMYMHALTTLACAEMYGMDPDPVLEEKLRKAIALIIRAQSPSGGWRYNPAPGDQDLSVSVMQIVALRSANNAEIEVPAQVIEKAAAYVKTCASPAGGFGYSGPAQGTQMTAAGILSLQLLGKYDDPSIPKAVDFLSTLPIKWETGSITYFYYFHYYAIQAQYQVGGKSWNEWHPKIRELLLEKQNPDGSWDVPPGSSEASLNKIYWTAMASLVLEIYMHFLPAYQR